MAFAEPLVLADVTPTNHNYLLLFADASSSKRIDQTYTSPETNYLTVKHSESGSQSAGYTDRHLLSMVRTVLDANGVPRQLIVNATVTAARSSVITRSIIDHSVKQISNFLITAATMDKFLRGEY